MSSNNCKSDDPTVILIDRQPGSRPPITCSVTHFVSHQSRLTLTSQHTVKMVCFLGMTLCSILATVIACSRSLRISPVIPLPPEGPVNGQWSSWSPWSSCSISCAGPNQTSGTMTRVRHCNSPPPQQNGSFCLGPSTEVTDCFKTICPIPVDGGWADWTTWSACSGSCQSKGTIPTQTRSSSCSNPTPKNGGKDCEGESKHKRFCTWLQQCPVDGQWGEWIVSGACESVNMKPCAIGKKLYQRQCNRPPPSSTGKSCEGPKEKNEDCWFDIGCPSGLQPPLGLQAYGNGSGVFEVRWSSVPYGEVAVKYRLYLTIEDSNRTQVETLHQDVTATPPTEVSGRQYSTTVDLSRFLKHSYFASLAVRMSSFDFWNKESLLTSPYLSKARGVDGQWGQWDHWSDCSTQCLNQRGKRTRRRSCNAPIPGNGGNDCIGSAVMEVSCIGMEADC